MQSKQKLLFIGPVFFDYYKEIIRTAETLGYQVDYICDAPSNSSLSKALGRIDKRFIRYAMKRYFQYSVLPQFQGKAYDHVFVLLSMIFAFTSEMLETIKIANPHAQFVAYQWDSERHLPFVAKIHQYFDKVYSFDPYDCQRRKLYRFLPLFYTDLYGGIGKEQASSFDYDCCYIGTAHPKKLKEIDLMAEALKAHMPRQFIYHYMPSRLKYFYHKLTAPEYAGVKLSDFQREKLNSQQIGRLFQTSRCILDAPQGGQCGLTIRTIECLGAKRKLVTTNADIKNYDFYRESNILIFGGDAESIDWNSAFFTQPFSELPTEIYEKYALCNWLKTILS